MNHHRFIVKQHARRHFILSVPSSSRSKLQQYGSYKCSKPRSNIILLLLLLHLLNIHSLVPFHRYDILLMSYGKSNNHWVRHVVQKNFHSGVYAYNMNMIRPKLLLHNSLTIRNNFKSKIISRFHSDKSVHVSSTLYAKATTSKTTTKSNKSIAIIGGGASGIFASIHASLNPGIDVTVFEATSNVLNKVKISGGGRCNVLHDKTISSDILLLKGYPRGYKELRSICIQQYPITKAALWFESHNVTLKTEHDGRMFPITDSSQTVIDALLYTAQQQSVQIELRTKVIQIIPSFNNNNNNNEHEYPQFHVTYSNPNTGTTTQIFDAVIIATGSAPAGYALITGTSKTSSKTKTTTTSHQNSSSTIDRITNNATDVTDETSDNKNNNNIIHPFISTVPSLFTFNCKHAVTEPLGILAGLAGVSVPKVRISFTPSEIPSTKTVTETSTDDIKKKKLKKKKLPSYLTQEGPILITHHGLSGPAVLRLSSFGARDMALCNYRGILQINWIPDIVSKDICFDQLWSMTTSNPKKLIISQCPILIPSSSTTTIGNTLYNENVNNDIHNTYNDPTSTNDKPLVTALPKRLWQSLVVSCGISDTLCWGNINKQQVRLLSEQIMNCSIEMTSKSTNKEEFVTAGGIDLSCIQMKSMSSKYMNGLYFCGEVLNIDGITGGFNFYNCWSTGYVAGTSAASYVLSLQQQQRLS